MLPILKVTSVALLLGVAFTAQAAEPAKSNMAPLCKSCHMEDSNMLRGTLDSYVGKTKTFLMDIGTRKELFKVNECTNVKNLEEVDDLSSHKGKAFRVNFIEKNGEKIALLVTRFDILNSIDPSEKIDKAGLKELISHDKNAVVVDARPEVAYNLGHIPGSTVIPAAMPAEKMATMLPADKKTPLVFYCVGGCSSPTAAMKAKGLGYTNVKIYAGGFPDWIASEAAFIKPPVVAKNIQESPEAMVIVDVREGNVGTFIKGALHIPFSKLDTLQPMLPVKYKPIMPIVFYGDKAQDATKKAVEWGFKGARTLNISFDEWSKASFPVDTVAKQEVKYIAKPKPGTILFDEFEALLKNKPSDVIMLDVRTAGEVEQDGKFKEGINISVDALSSRLGELPKDKKIVVNCAAGIRAEQGYTILKDAGFKDVRYLDARIKFTKEGNHEISPN